MPPVQLLVTCLIDALVPEVGEAVVEVLERRGLEVEFPEAQTCCGQPAFNAGLAAEAARMAAHTVAVFDATEGPIVAPSGSCTAFLVHHAPALLAGWTKPMRRAAWPAGCASSRCSSTNRRPMLMASSRRPRSGLRGIPSCHGLRELGITDQPLHLLAGVSGVRAGRNHRRR